MDRRLEPSGVFQIRDMGGLDVVVESVGSVYHLEAKPRLRHQIAYGKYAWPANVPPPFLVRRHLSTPGSYAGGPSIGDAGSLS